MEYWINKKVVLMLAKVTITVASDSSLHDQLINTYLLFPSHNKSRSHSFH